MRYLPTRTHRFGELRRALGSVTPRTLAGVLRESSVAADRIQPML